MHALTIDRAALRYRLPESRPDLQGRLDRVRARLFEHALEAALADAGVSSNELVCVRTLRVALRVPEHIGDAALLERWAAELRHAMLERLREADPRELVRYASPIAALTDMARSLVREDRRRAWAWCSLGLIREAELGSSGAGLQALLRTLLERPTHVVALVANLAATPTPALRWLRGLPRTSRLALLDVALVAHGIDADTRTRLRAALVEFATHAADATLEALEPSAVGHATASPSSIEPTPLLPREPETGSRSPIAELLETLLRERGSLAEHEPDSRELIGLLVLLATLDAASLTASARFTRALASPTRAPIVALARSIGVALLRPRAVGERGPSRHAGKPATVAAGSHADAHAGPGSRGARAPAPTADVAPADTSTSRERARASESPAAWRDEPLDARVRATSEWGGLLLVLAIVRSEQLWQRITELAELEGVDARRLLHAFGRSLIPEPLAPDDPALLAFVGLLPTAPLDPLEPEPPRERLATLRSTLITALERRLPLREYRPARGDALLSWLLRRHAELLGQPGWLEVHFRLRDVDTDIRRAGLDLDPGWLPELGLVMKFVYV